MMDCKRLYERVSMLYESELRDLLTERMFEYAYLNAPERVDCSGQPILLKIRRSYGGKVVVEFLLKEITEDNENYILTIDETDFFVAFNLKHTEFVSIVNATYRKLYLLNLYHEK
jgi:hypothetical protein